jgi:hypothetical protein
MTIRHDSLLLQPFLSRTGNDPPLLATRNKNCHVSRLRRASCTMRGEVNMNRILPMQTTIGAAPDENSSCSCSVHVLAL